MCSKFCSVSNIRCFLPGMRSDTELISLTKHFNIRKSEETEVSLSFSTVLYYRSVKRGKPCAVMDDQCGGCVQDLADPADS